VKRRSVCIKPPKTKKPHKLSIGHPKPLSLCHPMELPSVSMLLDIQSSIELGNCLIVPILLKGHHISQVLSFACSHNLVKECVILVLHIPPIYPLRDGNWLILGKDHRLIKVLLKETMKSIVSGLPLLELGIFVPFLSHSLSLSHVIHLCPPTGF
jgi:hypothetical protein